MRLAHQVWSGIAAAVFVAVAITDLSSTRTTATAATSSATTPAAGSTSQPATAAGSAAAAASDPAATGPGEAAGPGEVVTVTTVIDGDTIEVTGGRKIQIMAIDACEPGTYGGEQALASARSMLEGQPVTLSRAPGVSTDRKGNDLRFVAFSSGDFGEFAVSAAHTTVYGKHGAPKEYLADLRSRDDGPQQCSSPSSGYDSDDSGSIDVPTPGDQGLPDGLLTGGYCRKKWWC